MLLIYLFETVNALLVELTWIYQEWFAQSPRELIDSEESTVIDYNNRGNTYDALQRYEDALTNYNQAVDLAPRFTHTYNNRGDTYRNMQRYEDALVDFDRAIELDPGYAQAYIIVLLLTTT